MIVGLISLKIQNSTNFHANSVGEWEKTDVWREKGKCMDCHKKYDKFITDKNDKLAVIFPTQYHTEQFRRFAHGIKQEINAESCLSCHRSDTCLSCHLKKPESHTRDFIRVAGEGRESHTTLGRLSPTSCLVCHRNSKRECLECHVLSEMSKWEEDKHENLEKWLKIINDEI